MSGANHKTQMCFYHGMTCTSATGLGKMFLGKGMMNSATYISMLSKVVEPFIAKLYPGMSKSSVIF